MAALKLTHLNRMRRITQTLVRHGLLGLLDGATGGLDAARAGRRLARALDELGPTFVKIGQVLSTREDMLPPAFARELATLQDRAAPFDVRVARAQVESSLGAPIAKCFGRFDEQPLAAGSIAQIHRARTLAGDEVVVKIRRPGIRNSVAEDVELLEALAEQLIKRFPGAAQHDPVGFVREFARGLTAELDFAREADSLRQMRRVVGRAAHVPRVYAELSKAGVLTMEYVEGKKVSSLAGDELRVGAARRVVACFTDQYLRGDLFHADPHAGNILWREQGGLALLDLGAVGMIDAPMRRSLRQLAIAALRRDEVGLARALLTMVHAPADLDRGAVERDLGRMVIGLLGGPLGDVPVSRLVRDVFALAQRHGLRFRAEYFLLFRSAMLVDGVLRGLDPKIDPVAAGRAYIVRSFWRPVWMLPAVFLGVHGLTQHSLQAIARYRFAPAAMALALCALVMGRLWGGVAAAQPPMLRLPAPQIVPLVSADALAITPTPLSPGLAVALAPRPRPRPAHQAPTHPAPAPTAQPAPVQPAPATAAEAAPAAPRPSLARPSKPPAKRVKATVKHPIVKSVRPATPATRSVKPALSGRKQPRRDRR